MGKYVFWQNLPSPHQAPLLNQLSSLGHTVSVVFEAPIPRWRTESGWTLPRWATNISLFETPTRAERLDILSRQTCDTVNVFSGLTAYPETHWTLGQSKRHSPGMVLAALEQWDSRGVKGRLQPLRWRRLSWKYSTHLDGILAIGAHAPAQYGRAFPTVPAFAFGYFPDVASALTGPRDLDCPHQLVFVGRLVRLKGLHLLLKALSEIRSDDWMLRVVGDGPARNDLALLAKELGLEGRVAWLGSLPRDKALLEIAAADRLVLPSLYDGWGAVVNEAALSGTPVVCSTHAGCHRMVVDAELGDVVDPVAPGLTCVLAHRLSQKPLDVDARRALAARANAVLSPAAGASLLDDIVSAITRRACS